MPKKYQDAAQMILLLFPPIFLQQEVVTYVHYNHMIAGQRAVRKSYLSQASDTHLSLVLYYVEMKGILISDIKVS